MTQVHLFISRVLRVRTPNLREQLRPREQLVPSLLAMEVRQTVVLDLLRYQHHQEATRRRLSLRVLLFSKHQMYRQNERRHVIKSHLVRWNLRTGIGVV